MAVLKLVPLIPSVRIAANYGRFHLAAAVSCIHAAAGADGSVHMAGAANGHCS